MSEVKEAVTVEEVEAQEETITPDMLEVSKKELLIAKVKHYGKYVAIGAGIAGLGYLAKKALDRSDDFGNDIIEGVFEEIEE